MKSHIRTLRLIDEQLSILPPLTGVRSLLQALRAVVAEHLEIADKIRQILFVFPVP